MEIKHIIIHTEDVVGYVIYKANRKRVVITAYSLESDNILVSNECFIRGMFYDKTVTFQEGANIWE